MHSYIGYEFPFENQNVGTVGRTSWEWTFFPNLSQSFAVSYQIFFIIEICGKYQDNNFPKKIFFDIIKFNRYMPR